MEEQEDPQRPKAPAWNPYLTTCPTRQVLDCIADKWTVLVMGLLLGGTRRFGELRRDIQGVSQKMLTQTLRSLERDGIVRREVYATVPPKVEYSLTTLGESLAATLDELRLWAERNIEDVLRHRVTFDAAAGDGLPASAKSR
jgi:DNA-binding HxlR family transcriptional regulator